jgi:hypothetical protein
MTTTHQQQSNHARIVLGCCVPSWNRGAPPVMASPSPVPLLSRIGVRHCVCSSRPSNAPSYEQSDLEIFQPQKGQPMIAVSRPMQQDVEGYSTEFGIENLEIAPHTVKIVSLIYCSQPLDFLEPTVFGCGCRATAIVGSSRDILLYLALYRSQWRQDQYSMLQQNGESPLREDVQTLTWTYRYEALNVCQDNSTTTAWTVSQHLLDQCWDDTIRAGTTTTAITHICPACGTTLHPGMNSSRIRVARFSNLKAERTRRRRNLRKQKRLRTVVQHKQNKDVNPSSTRNKVEDNAVMRRMLLQDDHDLLFDRHHLTLHCGRCDNRTRLRGLKRDVKPTKRDIQSKQNPTSRAIKVPKKAIMEEKGADGGDFLELPSAGTDLPRRAQPELLRLVGQTSKKGKKKKVEGDAKKSKLMSFLSSLND